MHRTRELEDTPAVRGMIDKVSHLVTVEETAVTGVLARPAAEEVSK